MLPSSMVAPQVVPKVDWVKVRAGYVAGVPVRDLAVQYGVSRQSIYGRVFRNRWTRQREDAQNFIVERAVVSIAQRARAWTDETVSRMGRFRASVLKSLGETEEKLSEKEKPLALDQLTKAEMRVDDMGRRALGLVDPRHVDITSGGMPLGAFSEAVAEVRKMVQAGGACARTVDVETIAGVALSDGDGGGVHGSGSDAGEEDADGVV